MNTLSVRSALVAWIPAALFSAALAPLSFADCCGGRGGGSAGGGRPGVDLSPRDAERYANLHGMFGGSSQQTILLKNNSPTQTVSFQIAGKTVVLAPAVSKRRTFGGVDASTAAIPPLPGEAMSPSLSNSTGNTGDTPTVSVTTEDECRRRETYDATGTTGWEKAENTISLAIPAVSGVTTGPLWRIPVSARGESEALVPSMVDTNDFGFGGAVVTQGGVTLDNGQVPKIVVSNTGVVVVASLGNSTDGGSGRLGYIIPAATGTGSVYQFHERNSYIVRGVDLTGATYTDGTSVTRYKTVNGMAELTQTSTYVLTFKFFSNGTFSSSSPYAPNQGATPLRTMTVQRLFSDNGSNPSSNVYKCGAQVTTSRPGRDDEVNKMWFNECDASITSASNSGSDTTLTVGVASAIQFVGLTKATVTGSSNTSLNGTWTISAVNTDAPGTVTVTRSGDVVGFGTPKLKNGILSACAVGGNGITITTSSTVPTIASPERSVDTTVTENFNDASSPTVTSGTVTLTHRYRENVVSLTDGEEQVKSHTVFLTDNVAGPSLTTTYDYYPDTADAINRRTLARTIEAGGRWAVSIRHDYGSNWTDSVDLRGWKNQTAPSLAATDTFAECEVLLESAGYAGTYTLTDPRGRFASADEWVDGSQQAFKYDDIASYTGNPAYPYCHVLFVAAGVGGVEQFDTYTYEMGWDSANPTSVSAESTIPELRHRPRDIYRFKSHSVAVSSQSPTGSISAGDLITHTHYRYLSAGASANHPGYTTPVSYNATGYDVVDIVEDAAHLPSPMTRTVSDRATGRTVATERYMVTAVDSGTKDPTSLEVLNQESTKVDAQGRPTTTVLNGQVIESREYPGGAVVEYQDRTGAVHVTQYTPAGWVVYTMRENVAAMSFSGVTGHTSAAQPAIFTEYTYTPRTGGGSQFALYDVGITTVARAGTTLASSALEDDQSVPWSRTVYEGYDGAGRLVYSSDLNQTENAIARPTDQATSPVTKRRLGASTASGTILEETETYLDGRIKQRSGASVVTEYFDYSAYYCVLKTYRSPVSPATDGNIETVDALGRTVSTATMNPYGTSVPQSTNQFYAASTYDEFGQLASRQMAGAPDTYYGVFSRTHSTTSGSDRIIESARSTDSTYSTNHTSDENYTRSLARYEKISGMWYAVQESQFWSGSAWISFSWSRDALGPFGATGTNVTLSLLTDLTQTYRGGATVLTARYILPVARKTLVQTSFDGVVQQSLYSGCGRPLFLQTARFEKLLTHTPLGDPLHQVSATEPAWAGVNYYTASGLVKSDTTPGSSEERESYAYYTGNVTSAGLLSSKTQSYAATAPITYYDYNALGQLTHQWGGGVYPARYTYDIHGRMTYLETWRSGTWTGSTWPGSPPTADVTQWSYNTNWFDQPNIKTYMAGPGGTEANARKTVRYVYRANGSLWTREWQRTGGGTATNDARGDGITTTYNYDAYARLTTMDYPAASTMATATTDVTFTYDKAGRAATRTDGAGTTTNTWTDWGQLSKESLVTSISGVTSVTAEVERTFDGSNRIDLLKAKWGTGTMVAPDVDYGFDGSGYLNTISTAGRSVTPSLATGSLKWGTLAFKNNTTTLLTATRTLDSAGRSNYISYTEGGTVFRTFNYTYDRDRVTKTVHDQGNTADEMAWVYGYDSKGQVTSADKRFSTSGAATGNFIAGYQTQYAFDEIGNRSGKDEGGSNTSTEGTGVRTTSYTPNALNQYTAITNPSSGSPVVQTFDVTGRRSSDSNTVTVTAGGSGSTADYQADPISGLHYSKVVNHTSTTGAGSYEAVTVDEASTTIDSGKYYLPPPSESLTYDADGNIRQDGRWAYLWDVENRLTSQTTRHTASSTYPGIRLTFGYDGLSRRLWKKVESTTNGSTWTIDTLETFLYDGWNLLMRVTINSSGTATARQTFVWGPDVASNPGGHSSWQSAGGIGGLLMVVDKDATAYTSTGDNYFPLMDRMGNVVGYRSSDSGSTAVLSAVYEYDAFGREMKSLGGASDKMPFRFSTKFTDAESGLVYYGYRYYDPVNGRWINRDPVGEEGGINLLNILGNKLTTSSDILGLQRVYKTAAEAITACSKQAKEKALSEVAAAQAQYQINVEKRKREGALFPEPQPEKEHEWGGRVCKWSYNQCFYCTPMVKGDKGDIAPEHTAKCDPGDSHAGIYHSHPAAAGLSPGDAGVAENGFPDDFDPPDPDASKKSKKDSAGHPIGAAYTDPKDGIIKVDIWFPILPKGMPGLRNPPGTVDDNSNARPR